MINVNPTEADYIATAIIDNDNFNVTNPTHKFRIIVRKVEKPTDIEMQYEGVTVKATDSRYYRATVNEYNVCGNYDLTVELLDKVNTTWEDGTTTDIHINFTLNAIDITDKELVAV